MRLYDTPLTTGSQIAGLEMPAITQGRLPVIRSLLYGLAGLLLGGVIHVAIIFMVPYYASHDAWAHIKSFGRDGQFHTLPVPEAGAEPLASLDPRMLQAVCRFTLARRPDTDACHACPTISGRWPSSTVADATSTASMTARRRARASTS